MMRAVGAKLSQSPARAGCSCECGAREIRATVISAPNTRLVRTRLALALLLMCLLPASALAAARSYRATDRTHDVSYLLDGKRLTVTLGKSTPATLRKAVSGFAVSVTCTGKASGAVSPGGWISAPASSMSTLNWPRGKAAVTVTLPGWKGAPANCEIDTSNGKALSLATFH